MVDIFISLGLGVLLLSAIGAVIAIFVVVETIACSDTKIAKGCTLPAIFAIAVLFLAYALGHTIFFG